MRPLEATCGHIDRLWNRVSSSQMRAPLAVDQSSDARVVTEVHVNARTPQPSKLRSEAMKTQICHLTRWLEPNRFLAFCLEVDPAPDGATITRAAILRKRPCPEKDWAYDLLAENRQLSPLHNPFLFTTENRGPNLRLLIDNRLLCSASDPAPSAGSIWIRTDNLSVFFRSRVEPV